MSALQLAVIGTDTGVGKTFVTLLLARGLRALGHRVWLHKPAACGGWDGTSSEDGRALRCACGDGQNPATVCPREFPEPCSPHLAARAVGVQLHLPELLAGIHALAGRPDDRTTGRPDLLLETAGGLLSPIVSDRSTNVDLLAALGWPALLVTRPHLGTLNHTALTVSEARRHGLRLLGLVLNRAQAPPPSLAVDTVADELVALTGLPLLANLPCGASDAAAIVLAEAVAALK